MLRPIYDDGDTSLILAVAGIYLLMNYLGRGGSASDLLLMVFVAILVIFTVSFYLLSISSYGGMC
ncbi:hypothetical protein [Vulcanisaeta distributa]|uniref:hypothetical protein n=1 Tax=Vulcanisaeta distributa TaxID=164451 RepID=UPI000B2798D1|nr:hypothetical protein [Vulcanisaeta distributa]